MSRISLGGRFLLHKAAGMKLPRPPPQSPGDYQPRPSARWVGRGTKCHFPCYDRPHRSQPVRNWTLDRTPAILRTACHFATVSRGSRHLHLRHHHQNLWLLHLLWMDAWPSELETLEIIDCDMTAYGHRLAISSQPIAIVSLLVHRRRVIQKWLHSHCTRTTARSSDCTRNAQCVMKQLPQCATKRFWSVI